jgi:hypothetical protein
VPRACVRSSLRWLLHRLVWTLDVVSSSAERSHSAAHVPGRRDEIEHGLTPRCRCPGLGVPSGPHDVVSLGGVCDPNGARPSVRPSRSLISAARLRRHRGRPVSAVDPTDRRLPAATGPGSPIAPGHAGQRHPGCSASCQGPRRRLPGSRNRTWLPLVDAACEQTRPASANARNRRSAPDHGHGAPRQNRRSVARARSATRVPRVRWRRSLHPAPIARCGRPVPVGSPAQNDPARDRQICASASAAFP